MLSHLKALTRSVPDHRIISDLQQGGIARRKSEDDLFNAYSYYIREGSKQYALSEEECFDAYSDTILSVINTIVEGRFEERSSIKTFVYRVFHNKCVDLIRKSTTNKESVNHTIELPEQLFQLSDAAKSIVQKLVEKADLDEMREKLKKIGDNCRQLLMLFAEGLSDREIATTMHYNSPDVVKTSRLRCLQKLRTSYATVKKL